MYNILTYSEALGVDFSPWVVMVPVIQGTMAWIGALCILGLCWKFRRILAWFFALRGVYVAATATERVWAAWGAVRLFKK